MSKRDYYDILGVRKTATLEEIKAAHRKLVRKYHPDANPSDKSAEAKFKEIQEAYDVLTDSNKRRNYDQFGHAGVGASGPAPGGYGPDLYEQFRRAGYGGGMGGDAFDPEQIDESRFGSIFDQLFGSQGPFGRGRRQPEPPPGGDVEYPVTINFKEAARGTSLPIQIARGGRMETIEVKVPAGVKDGARVRVRGRGHNAGDLFIIVSVRPHEYFRREGLDVLLDLPISLYEAIEGTKVTVPTLDGPVELSVRPFTSSNTKLRIPGRGVHRGQEKGDQLCVVKIVVPRSMSETDLNLLREIARRNPVNARGDLPW